MLGNLGKLSSLVLDQTNWKEGEDVGDLDLDYKEEESEKDDDDDEEEDGECVQISHDARSLHRYRQQRRWAIGRVLQRYF